MRLLLDEHYPREITERLRELGHDAVAVQERPELLGLADASLFAVARDERRALVTEDWHDFRELVTTAGEERPDHFGVIVTSPRALPRARRTIGQFVGVLDDYLRVNPADDALRNGVRWLP